MRPHISHRFPMERAADAFRALIDRKVVGKAVILAILSKRGICPAIKFIARARHGPETL